MADFRREYGITADELFDLNELEFRWLLTGLTGDSRFAQATANEPVELTGSSAAAFLRGL